MSLLAADLAALLLYNVRRDGWRTLRNVAAYCVDRPTHADEGFDARHGTDTAGLVTPEAAGLVGERAAQAVFYYPSAESDVELTLDALDWPAERIRETTFVDLGCGKGRVLLIASRRPFRALVGVELSAALLEVARRNVARWCRDHALGGERFELVHGDAAMFEVPAGPTVVYVYQSFGAPVMAAAMERIAASLAADPRPLAVIYRRGWTSPPYPPELFAAGQLSLVRDHVVRGRLHESGWQLWESRFR